MATPHLVSTTANTKHLAAVRKSSESASDGHLVVLTQETDWADKQMRVTPSSQRWSACMGTGIEAYPSIQGTPAVYNDTQLLINKTRSQMNSCSWRSGYRPVVNSYIRGLPGPYSKRSGVSSSSARSEYFHSVSAYKFNLYNLPFSRMTSFKAYLRVYAPSAVFQTDGTIEGIYHCLLVPGPIYGNASKLCCRLATTLPTRPSADVAYGYDMWETWNQGANGGRTVTQDTQVTRHSVAYTPYHGDDISTMPVYTTNARTGNTPAVPSMFYHDWELTNTGNLNTLKNNPSSVWAIVHYYMGNAFAENRSGNYGMRPRTSATCWLYRADLIFKCTSSKLK